MKRKRWKQRVYFATSDTGITKIGISMNVEKRVRDVGTRAKLKMKLVASIPGDCWTERLCHKNAHEWLVPGMGLEWFNLSEAQLAEVIRAAKANWRYRSRRRHYILKMPYKRFLTGRNYFLRRIARLRRRLAETRERYMVVWIGDKIHALRDSLFFYEQSEPKCYSGFRIWLLRQTEEATS